MQQATRQEKYLNYLIKFEWNSKDKIMKCLNGGARVNAFEADGYSALMNSLIYWNKNIFELMLKFGGDVYAKNERGFNTLDIANILGKEELVRYVKAENLKAQKEKARAEPQLLKSKEAAVALAPCRLYPDREQVDFESLCTNFCERISNPCTENRSILKSLCANSCEGVFNYCRELVDFEKSLYELLQRSF